MLENKSIKLEFIKFPSISIFNSSFIFFYFCFIKSDSKDEKMKICFKSNILNTSRFINIQLSFTWPPPRYDLMNP